MDVQNTNINNNVVEGAITPLSKLRGPERRRPLHRKIKKNHRVPEATPKRVYSMSANEYSDLKNRLSAAVHKKPSRRVPPAFTGITVNLPSNISETEFANLGRTLKAHMPKDIDLVRLTSGFRETEVLSQRVEHGIHLNKVMRGFVSKSSPLDCSVVKHAFANGVDIGQGCYGTARQSFLANGMPVVVKKFELAEHKTFEDGMHEFAWSPYELRPYLTRPIRTNCKMYSVQEHAAQLPGERAITVRKFLALRPQSHTALSHALKLIKKAVIIMQKHELQHDDMHGDNVMVILDSNNIVTGVKIIDWGMCGHGRFKNSTWLATPNASPMSPPNNIITQMRRKMSRNNS